MKQTLDARLAWLANDLQSGGSSDNRARIAKQGERAVFMTTQRMNPLQEAI